MGAPTCTSADVARLILERVGDPGGDFTVDTHPTQAQVTSTITNIATEVKAVVGATVADALDELAELVVAVGTAALIELAFTDSEGARDPQSKYGQLQARYELLLERLKVAQADVGSGDALGEGYVGPWATMPDPPYDGTPATTWTERY